jgi:hypothetical protein
LDKAEALLQQIFDRVLVILSMKQRNTYSWTTPDVTVQAWRLPQGLLVWADEN